MSSTGLARRPGQGDRMSASSSAHLSELTLFRLAGGELVTSTSEGDQAMAHLHDCSRCADDYGKLLGDVQAFAFRPGLPRLARQMQRRATRRRFGRHLALAASAAAVMAAVVIPVLVRRDRAISSVDAGIRGKGGTKLQLFVKHRSGVVEAMLPNGTASPGDALRFWVDVPAMDIWASSASTAPGWSARMCQRPGSCDR